jgi:hypothetical protein
MKGNIFLKVLVSIIIEGMFAQVEAGIPLGNRSAVRISLTGDSAPALNKDMFQPAFAVFGLDIVTEKGLEITAAAQGFVP